MNEEIDEARARIRSLEEELVEARSSAWMGWGVLVWTLVHVVGY